MTSDLRLEEGLMESSNSSSSSTTTTASSADRVKIYPEETLFRPSAILKRPTPPLPPPRTTLSRAEEITANGVPVRDSLAEKGHASRCPQTTRERVRFSEKVQYHGYCPDCDLQCDVDSTDLHLHTDAIDGKPSPPAPLFDAV